MTKTVDGVRSCGFDGCDRRHSAHGLCQGHLRQQRAGQELSALAPATARVSLPARRCLSCGHDFKPRSEGLEMCANCRRLKDPLGDRAKTFRAPEGRKWCKDCQRYRAIRFFPKGKARCKPCNRLWSSDQRARNRYGMQPGEYAELKESQGGKCAICQRATGASKSLAIDHDHSCCPGPTSCGKCVRGLLCSNCNHMLGWVRDDPQAFIRAAEYLTKTPYQRLKEARDDTQPTTQRDDDIRRSEEDRSSTRRGDVPTPGRDGDGSGCPTCSACAACDGSCGVCPYARHTHRDEPGGTAALPVEPARRPDEDADPFAGFLNA